MTRIKFFSHSLMQLDNLEKEVNEFCKDKKVLNVFFQEIAELAVIVIVYEEIK